MIFSLRHVLVPLGFVVGEARTKLAESCSSPSVAAYATEGWAAQNRRPRSQAQAMGVPRKNITQRQLSCCRQVANACTGDSEHGRCASGCATSQPHSCQMRRGWVCSKKFFQRLSIRGDDDETEDNFEGAVGATEKVLEACDSAGEATINSCQKPWTWQGSAVSVATCWTRAMQQVCWTPGRQTLASVQPGVTQSVFRAQTLQCRSSNCYWVQAQALAKAVG